MLFIVTSFNYGDRATLSIAGSEMAKDIGLDPVGMGYVFSAFSWAYVIGQIPGGWLLDRFGSKRVYFWSIFIWSLFTLLQGFVDIFSGFGIIVALFPLRFLVGLAEAPSFPGNSRIVAAWFPAQERGTAVAIFNSAQYFATVIFAPIMGWLTHEVGWSHVFFFMGGLGIVISFIWLKVIHEPNQHPGVNKKELEYIAEGGALINMDQKSEKQKSRSARNGRRSSSSSGSRMMIGIYLGQYCINALTYFFITWFPVYLVQARGMSILKAGFVASVPAICGFVGGVLGGVISDWLMRRTGSLNIARKTPIVLGMLLSMTMVFCNYVSAEWMIIGFMAMAFFGKGIGALGWAVMADTAPKEISGLSGGLFNMFGNISGIVTPIAIGYIVGTTGSFKGRADLCRRACAGGGLSYLVLVGDIKRVELKPRSYRSAADDNASESATVITEMKVIPVAGQDSMLLNIGGAHNAWFTRNIVVLTDSAGNTGVGEAPGGEVIYQTLVDAIPQVVGQEVARLNKVVQRVHKGNQSADFDTFGKGAWTFELRVNAVAALEAALLDLLGKALKRSGLRTAGAGQTARCGHRAGLSVLRWRSQ